MGAIKLSDGREIEVNATGMTMREYRALVTPGGKAEDDDRTLSKFCGLSVDELIDLPVPDYRAIVMAVIRSANTAPDPNSQSASTSQ